MDDITADFLVETTESLADLDNCLIALERSPEDASIITKVFRILHTIKGTCGFLGLPRLEKVAHKGEDVLGLFRDKKLSVQSSHISLILRAVDIIKQIVAGLQATGKEPEGDDSEVIAAFEAIYNSVSGGGEMIDFQPISVAQMEDPAVFSPAPAVEAPKAKAEEAPAAHAEAASQTLRVNVDVLENLMTMVSELVLTRNQLLQIARQYKESEFLTPLQRLNHVVSDLQEGVMKTRMQPIGNAWAKLPRIVRDVSAELGKKIELEMSGQETELDRQVLEMIKDPLTHMVRNSADHGIEKPEERLAKGKSEVGKIRLASFHQGGHILIEISDDGKGLPIDKIKSKILQNRLATEEQLAVMSVQQIQQYIFHAGFSTAEKVTAVSGRGVGMDVVRSNIEKIGGSIEMKSVEGAGTTFTIKIPLTLAIVSALIIGVQGERYAIPQLAVSELVMVGDNNSSQLEIIDGSPVLRLREELLPLISLGKLLNLPEQKDGKIKYIVVLRVGTVMFGLIVDQVYDMEEIVVKPMSKCLKGLQIFSGNTILGDGRVIMIIDVLGVLKAIGMKDASDAKDVDSSQKTDGKGAKENLLLLFKAGNRTLKAAPISLISRLEEIELTKIEFSNGRHVIQYLGHLMPVLNVEEGEKTDGKKPLIIFKHGDRNVGYLVDQILDITKYFGSYQERDQEEILDSVIINDKAADIINPVWYAQQGISIPVTA